MAEPKDEFERHRERCFAAAYRMLGSVADAEDTVQEVWLRWSAQERSEVADPEAYLVRIATRLALNRLRAMRARRESYVGPWLPEPLMTEPTVPDVAEHELQLVTLNNEPGALLWFGDAPAKAMTVNVVDGRVQQVFVVPNPDKLTALSRSASVSPRAHQGA